MELTNGIDVSKWQGKIDWFKVKKDPQNIKFAIIKASQGMNGKDATFERNWRACKKEGIKCSAYHFFLLGSDPAKQAENFINTVGKDAKFDLPPVLDFEDPDKKANFTVLQIIEKVKIWLDIVEKAFGIKPIIYTGAYYWQEKLRNTKEFGDYLLWLARYGKAGEPSKIDPKKLQAFGGFKTWAIWQFTCKAKIQGITGDVDMNYLKTEFFPSITV